MQIPNLFLLLFFLIHGRDASYIDSSRLTVAEGMATATNSTANTRGNSGGVGFLSMVASDSFLRSGSYSDIAIPSTKIEMGQSRYGINFPMKAMGQ